MHRKVWIVLAVVAALVGLVFALPTPQSPGAAVQSPGTFGKPSAGGLPATDFAIRDVRLFDGERVREHMTVTVEGGHIGRVEEASAAGAKSAGGSELSVVDGRGRTLLPGLVDAHTHSWGDALSRALAFGVTTQLDQFGDVAEAVRLAAEQEADGAPGRADLVSAGTLVTRAGGHGTQFRASIPTLEPGADADAFVAARLAEGSAWIKLVIEDGSELGFDPLMPTLDAPTVAAVVAAAHRRGKLAVAHVHALAAARMAVAAGVDGLVHTVVDALPDATFARELAARHVFVVPTLSVLGERGAGNVPAGWGESLAADNRLAPWLRRGEMAQLRGTNAARFVGSASRRSVASASVAVWRDAGVSLVAGTDAANPGTTWGASLHGELELLVAAGMSPVEALAAATSRAADAFRLTDRGRIAVGQRADLLLVDGDPSRDITATRAIVGVWKLGHPLDRQLASTAHNPLLDQTGILVADFDATTPSVSVTTDGMMGGKSTAELGVEHDGEHDGGGYLRVTGEIRHGFPFPWAGGMLALGEPMMSPVDLGARSVLRFRARGDALRVMVLVEGMTQPFEEKVPPSPTWQARELDLAARGVAVDAVQGIVFCGGPDVGAFGFDVDDISLSP